MTSFDQESIMTKVMRMLAVAGDPRTNENERRLMEETAERLMAAHMIDRYEAEQKMKNTVTARKPVQSVWSLDLSDIANPDEEQRDRHEFDYQVVCIMEYVLGHCNIRVNPNWKYNRKVGGRVLRTYQIVGFQEDITYAERIWFNVFKGFVTNVNPIWDLNKSLGENAYAFACAGVNWEEQVLIATIKANIPDNRIETPLVYPPGTYYAGRVVDRRTGNEPCERSIHKLRRECKKYCADTGHMYPYTTGKKLRIASRTSFARSYRATIEQRLSDIARAKHQVGQGPVVDKERYALALRDTKQRVDEEFYRLFPEYDPEIQKRRREAEAEEARLEWEAMTPIEQEMAIKEQAAEDERWAKAAAKSRRRYGAIREDPADRFDAAAWARGKDAAERVNLRADEEVKNMTKKGIER